MERKHDRLGRRYGRLVWVIFFVLAVAAVAIFSLQFVPKPNFRQTGIFVGDPVIVFSWDASANKLILVTMPLDTTITGVGGAGQYTLRALWQLGAIDHSKRILLSQSIEDALGLPVSWYIGPKNDAIFSFPDAEKAARAVLSFPGVFSVMSGRYVTNMGITSQISLSWAFLFLRPDRVRVTPLTNTRTLETSPDGTTRNVLDLDQTDVVFGSMFEDDLLRAEAIRTEVLNTTGAPTLGNRVARLLGRMGVSVVAVGNDRPEVVKCELSGSKVRLASRTATFIENLYHCDKKEIGETRVADLVLRIGRDLKGYFLGTGN